MAFTCSVSLYDRRRQLDVSGDDVVISRIFLLGIACFPRFFRGASTAEESVFISQDMMDNIAHTVDGRLIMPLHRYKSSSGVVYGPVECVWGSKISHQHGDCNHVAI